MDASRSTPTATTTTPATPPPRHRRRAAAFVAAALAAGLLAGCTTAPAATPTASASAAAQVVALPDTVLGEQAQWVLDAINGEIDEPAAEAPEHVSSLLLEQISAQDLAAVFSQLAPQSPWVPTAVQDAGDSALITIAPASGDALDMQIAVGADGLIAGLLFSASAADRVPATSWSELEDSVEGFAADTTLTVTDVTDGASERIAAAGTGSAVGDTEAKPSGSMFKLYVLGAVAEAVAAGELTWETPLTVTDDVKSLPSGELQNAPSGTTVTVQEAAAQMIAISDNTATDMLMSAVGPAALERALADLGHHDPALNTPLLTTRAVFQLGWGAGGAGGQARADWSAATTEGDKRAVIDALPTGLLDIPVTAVTTPVWQDGLDWFTTPDDLAAVHLALQKLATTVAGAPIRDIIATNSGLGDLGDEWTYVAFKGGSSIGVLGGSWYLERADGRAFVITIQGSTAEASELGDQATFFGQVTDAVALLEKE
ncbi:serine hydrolase [Microbacterium sp. W1N]|uniref:serine hydrolase n=1 Tax=Microbacterium festucae TaxID=2977531 RepID=UPI0021BE9522|nr:serine hydrolase [Microbacterium festucae]MCT9821135.1 serine hydrolase [Microbacterium festucae]